MSLSCKGIFVIGAKRTPFCAYGGSLRELPACHVFAAAAKDVIHTADLDPTLIDSTIVGNVNYLSQCDGGKTPRYCGIYSGVPLEKPALGVNKACGSGLQAIATAALEIMTNQAKITLTGGTEVMSSLPLLVRNVRFGTTLGSSYQVEDHIKIPLVDTHTGLSLHQIAENMAVKYKLRREDVDEFSLQNHSKWQTAQDALVFKEELTSLNVNVNNKNVTVDKDEVPEARISAEVLAQMPSMVKYGNFVTAGNSAAPADGAAALLLAIEESLNDHKLVPLARVVGWTCVGVDPTQGLGAAAAIKRLLDDQGLKDHDVDLFEINDNFSSQVLATISELGVDPARVNVNGGALSVGHPVAATGARMAGHLVHLLRKYGKKRGIAASSCGGGQGIALLFEQV